MRKGSGLITNEPTDLRKNAGDDIIVVDTKRRGDMMIQIVNSHDQSSMVPGDRPARTLSWQNIMQQGGGGTGLAGDFDAHSKRCDPM